MPSEIFRRYFFSFYPKPPFQLLNFPQYRTFRAVNQVPSSRCGEYRLDLNHWLARKLIPACWLIIAVCGAFAFVQRDLLPYLLIQVDFAYFNHDESQAVFYVDFFAMLIAVAYTTRIAVWAVFFRKG